MHLKALKWVKQSGREKIASKSLNAFAGKALSVVKKSAEHGGTYTLLSIADASELLRSEWSL